MQTWIPFTQGCIVQNLVEIGTVVFEKKIFKCHQCIFAISQSSPLGKWRGTSFEQLEITQGWFVASLVEISFLVLENNMKLWKVYVGENDDGQRTNCDQLKNCDFMHYRDARQRKYYIYKSSRHDFYLHTYSSLCVYIFKIHKERLSKRIIVDNI